MDLELEAQDILNRFRDCPELWWKILDNFPPIYGPWEECEFTACNVDESYVRRIHGGRVMADVTHFTSDVTGRAYWRTALRADENPEWGMVDFTHEVKSAEEGMRLIDEELSRRGILLVAAGRL